MKINIWKSELTGKIYEAPIDWMPKFGGWQLIATITKKKKKMRDYFKRARCRDGYCRLDCTNKTARARAKRELKNYHRAGR